jgi:DUF4097 and DUF4098 domain-containing protein YvlB
MGFMLDIHRKRKIMRVTVNGIEIKNDGNISSFNVVKGNLVINGETVKLDDSPVFNIVVEGAVQEVSGDFADITVNGDAGDISTMSGDVHVTGQVNGDISTMSGDVKTKGSVAGSVSTMSGDIKTAK